MLLHLEDAVKYVQKSITEVVIMFQQNLTYSLYLAHFFNMPGIC